MEWLGDNVLAVIIVILVVAGMFYISRIGVPDVRRPGEGIQNVEFARGLITLLFSVGTIAIAIILTLAAVFQKDNDAEKRFARGKEVLSILVGIFGTIVGFYFGSVPDQAQRGAQAAEARKLEDGKKDEAKKDEAKKDEARKSGGKAPDGAGKSDQAGVAAK